MQNESQQPGWTYRPGEVQSASQPQQSDNPSSSAVAGAPAETDPGRSSKPAVTWTASEFVSHQKDTSWYAFFIGSLTGVVILIFLITRDIISSAVIGLAGILFIILAHHKPRELAYTLDDKGVTIGRKFYPYTQFKSFGLGREGVIGAINLMPLRRFMPELSIYYPPEEENKILAIISEHLPHDQREEQGVDRLLRKMKF